MPVSEVGISSSMVFANAHTFHIGTSNKAPDVLTGVASGHLLNVKRMIQLFSEKHETKMSPEVGMECVVKFRGSIILNPSLKELSRTCMYVL